MVNKNNLKKKVSIFLAASMILGSTITCSAEAVKNEKGKIHVLENQQQEIDDVLAINKIENFETESWLNDDEIIGVNKKNQVENVCIYNSKKNEMIPVTTNTDESIEFDIRGLCDLEKQFNNDFIIIQKFNKLKGKTSKVLDVFNLKDHSLKKIEGGTYFGKINNNKLIITKGYEIYEYNLATDEKNQIILPDEVNKKIKEVPSFNEYIDAAELTPEMRANKDDMNKYKEYYESSKEDAGIICADKNQNKLMLSTKYFKSYVYDLDTKTFEEDDACFRTIYGSELNAINRNSNSIIKIEEAEGNSKIWKLNSNGERYKLIDEGVILHYKESLDHSKLMYSMIEDIEGRQFANEVKTYICDLNSGKKTSLPGAEDIDPGIFWNKASDKLYFLENVFDETTRENKCITNVITFNSL